MRFAGESAESEEETGRRIVRFRIVLLDFGLERSSLRRPKTHESQTRDSYCLYQRALDFGLRGDLAGERGDEVGEGFGLFVLEDDDAGEEPVTEIVAGRFEAAGGRDRSARFGAVRAKDSMRRLLLISRFECSGQECGVLVSGGISGLESAKETLKDL